MTPLYPLKFRPIFVEKVWGGRAIATLGRDLPGGADTPIGESWELVDLEEARSSVANGPLEGWTLHDVIEEYGERLLGRLELSDGAFPLLVKYLDARKPLSVQVHPTVDYVQRHPKHRVKSEAWYIIDAEPGAVIYRGVRPGVTRDEFRRRLEDRSVVEALIEIPVKAGEMYYLPSGTCHALGAGILLAEIQTPSDSTFRLYDWDRTDREMHVEEAMQCVEMGAPDVRRNERKSHIAGVFTTISRILTCEHFQVERVRMSEGYGQEIPYDRPAVWIVLEGEGVITNTPAKIDVPFRRGDVLLIPARMSEARVQLNADTVWLDVQFPALLPGIYLA